MRRLPLILLFLSPLLILPCKSQNLDRNELERLAIDIPDPWIQKVRDHDPGKDTAAPLVSTFEKMIAPDTLALPYSKAYHERSFWYINPFFIDLDEDPDNEMLALIGKSEWDPMMAMFEEKENGWELVGKLAFHIYYEKPRLQLLNVASPNKPFAIRYLYGRGTGYLHTSSHLFKLIDGKVTKVLELLYQGRSISRAPWGLSKIFDPELGYKGIGEEELWVKYEYTYKLNTPRSGNMMILNGKEKVKFHWDPTRNRYELSSSGNEGREVARFRRYQKRTCNDSLFVRAFRKELEEVLLNGQKDRTKALKSYLQRVGTPIAGELLKGRE